MQNIRKLMTILRRFVLSYKYNKENFTLKKSKNVFLEIKNKKIWKSSESISGFGSTIENTKITRNAIQDIINQYDIKTILDIPCGDYNWMKELKLDCNYIGADIVQDIINMNQKKYRSNKIQFTKLDITKDKIPKVDLIICKDCLQHLSNENIIKAIKNLIKSHSKLLLVTSYPLTIRNYNIYDGDYRAVNLLIKPFSLNKYLLKIQEKESFEVEIDKNLYLFDLQNFNK